MSFREQIGARRAGILSYGLTPPRAAHEPAKLSEIAERQRAYTAMLPVDGIVLYDLQDETSREATPRPFPFLPTLDPFLYARDYLGQSSHELIVYRAVANYDERELAEWLCAADAAPEPAAVSFVGSPASHAPLGSRLGLPRAYELHAALCRRLLLGGICIAERHAKKRDEQHRILDKQRRGCSFFVSQAVYDARATEALLEDLAREAAEQGVLPAPILLTVTPCGSEKALEFMRWLGISVAPDVERRLRASSDMLGESVRVCEELIRHFARYRGAVPLGINVESVSVRRADIDAAAALVHFARAELSAAQRGF